MTEGKFKIRLPKEWGEISPFLFSHYLSDCRGGQAHAKINLWRRWDPESYRATKAMGVDQAAEIHAAVIEALEWIDTPPTRAIIEKFNGRNIGKRMLYFSDERMKTSTVREFILADSAYKKIVDAIEKGHNEAAEKHSRILLAIVARPLSPNRLKRFLATGDRRIRIQSQSHAEWLAARITTRKIEIYCAQAITYFTAVKNHINKVYGPHLFEEGETKRLNLGWTGHVMAVAETPVFGSVEATYDANFHHFLLYLIKRKQDAQSANKSAKPNQNQT